MILGLGLEHNPFASTLNVFHMFICVDLSEYTPACFV